MKIIPRQPHPDVAIVRNVFAQLKPGDTVPYAKVAAALGVSPDGDVMMRRATAARKQLRREGIVIECSNDGDNKAFVRQTDLAILDRHAGLERKGIARKARKAGEKLAAIDASALPEEKRAEYFAERTITNVIFTAAGSASKQKMLAAAKISTATLPMAKALEVLTNGK